MSNELITEESNTEFHCGCIVIGFKFTDKYHEDKWTKWDELSESLRDRIKQIQLGNSVIVDGDIIGVASNNQLSKISYKNIGGNVWIEDDAGQIKVDFTALCNVMNSILMSAVCPIEVWYEYRAELNDCKVTYVPITVNKYIDGTLNVWTPPATQYISMKEHQSWGEVGSLHRTFSINYPCRVYQFAADGEGRATFTFYIRDNGSSSGPVLGSGSQHASGHFGVRINCNIPLKANHTYWFDCYIDGYNKNIWTGIYVRWDPSIS